MMREILFRGKRMDNSEWLCGVYFPEPATIFHGEQYSFGSYVKADTVGQFTGLTDKNGKKIFEGDIIKFHKYRDEPDWVGAVSYEYCTYFAKGKMPLAYKKEIDKEAFHCPFEVTISGIDKTTIEVVGNVHDNPELLEGV